VAGLSVDVLSRLEGHNFRCAEDVLTRSSLDLVELLDISLPAAQRVVRAVAKNVCPKPTTARALLLSRTAQPSAQPFTPEPSEDVTAAAGGGVGGAGAGAGAAGATGVATSGAGRGGVGGVSTNVAFVRSHLFALDRALGGGIPTGSISELVGPAGAGKTQMCLSLAVAAAAPISAGGLGGGVVFIDTEQKFSGVRLAEIARAKFPHVYGAAAPFDAAQLALQQLTGKVLVLTPSTLSEILQRLNGLEEALIDHGKPYTLCTTR
jgi:RAD51-like protein 1